jgi:endonuclease-3
MDNKNIDKVIRTLKQEYKTFTIPIVTEISEKGHDPFLVLISTLLSLRTKDETTSKASYRLFKLAKTPKKMLSLTQKQIEKTIYPVGFYKTKAKRIKEVCDILIKEYKSIVPDDLDELLKLPGVGRKTANLVMTLGYNKLGICVDVHVHRISNRLGYVKTKTPEETEFALRAKLPKKYWIIYNDLLVAYGQNHCRPTSPFCSTCKVRKYCPRIGVTTSR